MKGLFIAILMGTLSATAFAEGTITAKVPTATKKWGTFVGIGDPFPGLIGLNGAYQVTPDLRVTAGYAEVEVTSSLSFDSSGVHEDKLKAQTYAVGAQYAFTNWAFRPNVGAHLGYFHVSGKGDFDLNGFKKSTMHAYTNAGFDYVSQSGFQAGLGMNLALINASGSGFYANLGWFF